MRVRSVFGMAALVTTMAFAILSCAPSETTPGKQATPGGAAQAPATGTQQVAGAQATPRATSAATSAAATPGAAVTAPGAAVSTPRATTTAPGAAGTPRAAAAPAPTFGPVQGSVRIMGVWGGDELNAFRSVAAEWEKMTGGKVEFEGTRDLSAVLTARVQGGNPPDLAILPNPALMTTYAQQGKLKALNQVLDMSRLQNDYAKAWIDLGTVNNQLYGLFVKGAPKNTVWYSPRQFSQNNLQVPKTWDEMISLSDQLASSGKNPWSMGMENGAASGWPGSDWIQEIYLRESGPDMYDKWVKHEIPWTDPSIKSAFQRFGKIALTQNYVSGGVQNILATNFTDASYLPFTDPPRAYMYFLGAFTQTFIAKQFPNLQPTQGYDFFPLPPINPQNEGAVTGGADIAVMFNDTPAARSFMTYMEWAKAWEPWAKAGGFSSPNRSFDASTYPDPVAAKAAQQLTDAKIFRFDADDTMPAEVQQAEWKAVLDYLRNPNDLDSILQNVENVAKGAYTR